MWAAANDGIRKRSRDGAGSNLSESEYDSDSSDGERSTTESINENDANAQPSTTLQQARKKPRRKRKKRPTRENPEATMARLTSSYSAAMAAVGALHRVSRQYSKQMENDNLQQNRGSKPAGNKVQNKVVTNQNEQGNQNPEISNNNENEKLQKAHDAIQRVAHAARTAFERSLLLDHIILAPIILPTEIDDGEDKNNKSIASSNRGNFRRRGAITTSESMSCTTSAWFNTWNCDSTTSNTINTAQWNRLNAAHHNTVKQISYLTLVNYADLLLCGCDCHRSDTANEGVFQNTLDKGAVKKLDALDLFSSMEQSTAQNIDETNGNGHSTCCLWRDETREQTLRLAVAAYCDASDLDPTDPTLWLKLACAARALDRESNPNATLPPKSFHCLERLALERGLSTLPKGVPPNRMLLRAWREIQKRDSLSSATYSECMMEVMVKPTEKAPVESVLELPRYSWSALGRILLDASKRGTSTSSSSGTHDEFGSPLLDIRISPLLSVPSKIIKGITGCLEKDDVISLTLTCKSITEMLTSKKDKTDTVPPMSTVTEQKDMPRASSNDQNELVSIEQNESNKKVSSESEKNATDDILSPRRGRVSKRVQSQTITSEKQSERRAKRSSAEYNLLAGLLSTTSQNPIYRNMLADLCWDKLSSFTPSQVFSPAKSGTRGIVSAQSKHRTECSSSPSSLSTFISSMCRTSSGPADALEQFLVHVSLHVTDVFSSESPDLVSSCVIDCFDVIAATENYSEVTSNWYGQETFDEGNLTLQRAIHVVSVNLLAAELLFKRIESNDSGDHPNDGVALDFMVPNLLQYIAMMSEYDALDDQRARFLELKCRANWLSSTYYTWLGHHCNDISVSKSADDASIECLDVCLQSLSKYQQINVDQNIETPHLQSPNRHGNHWSSLSADTLLKYKHYLLSTAVVSKVRSDFHQISCKLQEGLSLDTGPLSVTEDQKIELSSLACELVNRYKAGNDQGNEKIEELLNDFILVHGDHLTENNGSVHDWKVTASKLNGKAEWGKVWSVVPSTKNECIEEISSTSLSGPSIMHVLSCSLLLSESDTRPMFSIYPQLISYALESRARILQSCAEDRVEKGNVMLLASKLFVDKMTQKLTEEPTEIYHELENDRCRHILNGAIQMYLDLCPDEHDIESEAADKTCLSASRPALFKSASHLVFAVRQCPELSSATRHDIESNYFAGLVKALVVGKREFASLTSSVTDKRLKTWQMQLANKANKISFIANELAELMSKCTTGFESDGSIRVSHLIMGLTDCRNEHGQIEPVDIAPLAQLSDSLLWFWDYLNNTTDASSPTENSVKDLLLVPVCATMIALCGSPGVSIHLASAVSKQKHIPTNSDYFDSDDSVNGVFLPDSSVDSESLHSKRVLTRKYCQLAQCVSLVFEFSEKAAYREVPFPSKQHGPLLSLITVRTLSNMADGIFALFGEDIWNDEWPYGTRECGSTIDTVLSKAYNFIYGFSLTGQSPNSDSSSKSYAPESIVAAAQLFRCIKRVYNKHNRRSPPTRAFEVMEMALPNADENEVSKAIKEYIFDADKDIDAVRLSRFDNPPGLAEWVFDERDAPISLSDDESNCIDILRRGICRELAKGPISHLSSESEEGNEGLSEERESTQRYELSLSRKFNALLDDLSFHPRNIDNWMVLSECLGFKADIICDRLVRESDPYNTPDFCPPGAQAEKSTSAWNLDQLHEMQCREFQELRQKWLPFIGRDLRAYMQYPWSNLNSLRDCSKDIESSLLHQAAGNTTEESQEGDLLILKEIESMFEKEKYSSWAKCWAGMFITALRKMRMKALLVARYLAKKKFGTMHPSEVCEDIGTALYGDLMASTVYGFPCQLMSNYEKRAIAEGAKFYFEEAIVLSSSSDYGCESNTESWEVQFMIGKCSEKIASTLQGEQHPSDGDQPKRSYETAMIEAITNYSASLHDAQKVEKAGGGNDNKTGGSSHGSREVLYRLHASRLKVLLSAIRQTPDVRRLAETEAYVITSTSWYDGSNKLESSTVSVRDNTWDVFVDCVQGLASCRKAVPYFHRAAYRLSQALLWAPTFHDPNIYSLTGSIENIPAPKRNRISELFDKDSTFECAASVIEGLFDKKRPHLVATWVTTSTAPPPFEVLNDSVRKYDALRLKYIMAYIDTMVICKRRDKIETFLSWAMSSSQDMPGFYEASASSFRGGDAEKSLLSGSGFLTKVKRTAMTALAQMILKDLAAMKHMGMNEQARKLLKDDFKLSHNLFLRLNSTPEDVLRAVRSNKPLDEVVALCRCYLSIQSGRINSMKLDDSIDNAMLSSLLGGAAAKAKEMFPSKKSKLKTLKRQADDALT